MHARSCSRPAALTIAGALLALTPPAAAQWTAGPSLNNARHAPGVVRHGGDIYAVGGFSAGASIEVLRSQAMSWVSLAPLPTPQEGLAAAIVGDKIYTFGSYGPANTCQIYDILANTWQAGPPVPMPLYWASAEAVGTDIYLIGGYNPTGAGYLNTLFILDTTTSSWRSGASMPTTPYILSSAVHGPFLYVFGRLGAYFKYDLALGTWSTFPAPPSGHGGGTEAVSVGHFVYLIGGTASSGAYSTVEVFDPTTGAWANGPSLVNARAQFGAVHLPNEGNIYAVGGRATATSMTSVEVLAAVPNGFQRYGVGTAGSGAFVPELVGGGTANRGALISLDIASGLGRASGGVLIGIDPASKASVPMVGATLLVMPTVALSITLGGAVGVPGAGSVSVPLQLPNVPSLAGVNANFQAALLDAGAPGAVSATNGLGMWIR